MTKRTKKWLAILTMSTMLLSLLTGCGSGTPPPATEDKPTTPAANDTPAPAVAALDLTKIYNSISTEQTYIDINALPQPKASKQYTIGLAMLNVNTGFFKSLADSCKAEVEAMGGKALLADCESNASKQVSQIENFIAQGVDAIIVNPADPQEAVNIALNKAYDKGIPVISVDLPPDEGAQYLSACVTDAYQLGYLVGEELAKQLLQKYPTGEVQYGIIGGTEGNFIATNRNTGARDAIKAVQSGGSIVALGVNSPIVVGQVAARTIVDLLNDPSEVPASKLMAMQPELLTPENCEGFEGF